jgi:hypothetical protein
MLSASVLAILLAASPESGRPLVWDAPLECPGADWLATRVEAYLGRPLTAAELDELDARGLGGRVAVGADGRFEVVLEIGDAVARHRIRDHDCRRLADLAASLLAIAIDPLALGGAVVPIEQAEPAITVPRLQTPEVVPPSVPAESPRTEPGPEPSWELVPLGGSPEADRARESPPGRASGVVLADVGFAFGLFPNLAPEVHGGVGLGLRDPDRHVGVRVDLLGGAALAGRFRARDGRDVGGDLLAWDIGARPCVVPRWGLVDLRGCVSVGAGQLRGRGVGVQDPQTIAQPWIRTGVELGVAVALRRRSSAVPRVGAALFVDLGAGLHALRPNLVILAPDGGADVGYVMPPGSVHGRVGFELRFF